MSGLRWPPLIIGTIFGVFYLLFFIVEGVFRDMGWVLRDPVALVITIAGPFSLIVATLVALRWPAFGGWWLVAGALVTTILFSLRLWGRPANLLAALSFYSLPMLVSGGLWLGYMIRSNGGKRLP